jgi:hypothetical protein
MPAPTVWLAAFALTLAVELPVLWLLVRRRVGYLLGVGLLVNATTHPPALWLALALGWPFLLVEAVVWAVESGLLAALLDLPLRRAVVVAGTANLASALVGILVFW